MESEGQVPNFDDKMHYDIFIYKYILYKITLIFSCFPVLPLFDEVINVSLCNLFTNGNFSI